MKNKKCLKNVFYIFSAILFAGITLTFLPFTFHAKALDTNPDNVENAETLPDYFKVEDFVIEDGEQTANENSLVNFDTFFFDDNESLSQSLKISFEENGKINDSIDADDDIYSHVFYPDTSDRSTFYFFSGIQVNLNINGKSVLTKEDDSAQKKYVIPTDFSFPNMSTVHLEDFCIIFNKNGSGSNEFSIYENGEIREGLYTLSVSYFLYECRNAGPSTGLSDLVITEKDHQPPIVYNFFVAKRSDYIVSNRPVVENSGFDHVVNISNTQNPDAFWLYSNYSSKIEAEGIESEFEIPYIEYDYTRFEINVKKELSGSSYYSYLKYNKTASSNPEESPVDVSGDEIVLTQLYEHDHKVRVYFTDVGQYTLSLKAIQVVDVAPSIDASETVVNKFDLDGVTSISKGIKVHMFGYQLRYTDYDHEANSNNVRPTKDLRSYHLYDDEKSPVDGTFTDSADVTSKFLNSSSNYAQSTSTTFTTTNIFNFLNKDQSGAVVQTPNKDTKYAITPIKTNQPPLSFISNATPPTGADVQRYIYTTANLSGAGYNEISNKLQGETVYRANFEGLTEETPGKYVYLVAYTYDNYQETEESPNAQKLFYQIFFFEIVKELTNINIYTTEENQNYPVYADTYVNKDITVEDITKQDKYSKEVTVQIYAYDYVNQIYSTDYNGRQGRSLQDLSGGMDTLVLRDNAKYIIRLYYTNEIPLGNAETSKKLDVETGYGFLREQVFTKDSIEVSGLKQRNFQQLNGSSVYLYHSYVEDFSTNQSVALSWNKKDSGANTTAYYKYFPLLDGVEGQYYSSNDQTLNSSLLKAMLQIDGKEFMPVNRVLDLSNTDSQINNGWTLYEAGNSKGLDRLDSSYILSDPGLYLMDVYDEAGNHTTDVFMIDNSVPMFAIERNGVYSIPSTFTVENSTVTLYWGQNKAIYVGGNFNSSIYTNTSYSVENIPEEIKKDNFYKSYNGKTNDQIYKELRKKLFDKQKMQYISLNEQLSPDGTNSLITTYTGMYITVPIDPISFYSAKNDDESNSAPYLKQENIFKQVIQDQEQTYTILIRDQSNTKRDMSVDAYADIQYTNYYSATQTVILSFDSSMLFIQYEQQTANGTEIRPITSNNTIVTDLDSPSGNSEHRVHQNQTTYLSPTRMEKAFILSFRPTFKQNNIQVQSVDMEYYEYEPYYEKDTNYFYSRLAKEPITTNFYTFKNEDDESTNTVYLNLDADKLFTKSGKYVISRTYKVDGDYKYNQNDYYKRTIEFIVDRNTVITEPERLVVGDESHSENFVGGDIFVSMYDTGVSSSLVVNFPDSDQGNLDGTSLYNSGSYNIVLESNKLPVNIYVPRFKYTRYSEKQEFQNSLGDVTSYKFNVNYDFEQQQINQQGNEKTFGIDGMNNYLDEVDENGTHTKNAINEYVLYATIYKDVDPIMPTAKPIAVTSTNSTDVSLQSVLSAGNENGFLNFYDYETGNLMKPITAPGIYYVQVHQGRFGTGIEENRYQQTLTFQFQILESKPDFEVTATNNQALGHIPTPNLEISDTYYTNQPSVIVAWDNARDKFHANIDIYGEENGIEFTTSNATFSANDAIWVEKPSLQSNNTRWVGILNLDALNIYKNEGFVNITMKYENFDEDYYSPVKKQIRVDLTAPSENVEALVARSLAENPISSFNKKALRVYQSASPVQPDAISYNISNSTSDFAYYSYSVNDADLKALYKNVEGVSTYVKKFTDNGKNTKYESGYSQEVSPALFSESKYSEINSVSDDFFEKGCYYEVVEVDLARNMSIYTIYVPNLSESENLITYDTIINKAEETKSYTIADYNRVKARNDNSINNIYSKTGFKLENINFFGDAWARMELTTYKKNENGTVNSTITNLMLSPKNPGEVYNFPADGTAPTKVSISSLIDGDTSLINKHSLKIYNRLTGEFDVFYFTIHNSSLTANFSNSSTREFISFANVSADDIKNTRIATETPYIVELKISIDGNPIYSETLADGTVVGVRNPLGYAELWKNYNAGTNEYVRVTISGNRLVFEVNPNYPANRNARVLYEFTDNFGQTQREIHLFHETSPEREVTSQNEGTNEEYKLYSYYHPTTGELVYIVKDGLQYTYNQNKYRIVPVEVPFFGSTDEINFTGNATQVQTDHTIARYTANDEGTTITFNVINTKEAYNLNYILKIYDANIPEEQNPKPLKTINFTLYDELPRHNQSTTEANDSGEFQIRDVNGTDITEKILSPSPDEFGYYSQIRILYTPAETYIPVKFMLSSDEMQTWKEIPTGTRLQNISGELEKYYLKIWYDNTTLTNELGSTTYVFGVVPQTRIYAFTLSALTSNYWVEKRVDGVSSVVEKTGTAYVAPDNTVWSNHYIVNVSYDNRDLVTIRVNNEQEITWEEDPDYDGPWIVGDVYSVKYNISNSGKTHSGIANFSTTIVITYIPDKPDFLDTFYTYDETGSLNAENLLDLDKPEKSVHIPETSNLDRIRLEWSKYYGIKENEIYIKVSLIDKNLPNGKLDLSPVTYSRKSGEEEFNYTYLTYSGLYNISFEDSAGNRQKFNTDTGRTDIFSFMFLKDVPFTVTYTDTTTNETVTALPIKQAIYNSDVTLKIDSDNRSKFYLVEGYPSITIRRNGRPYEKEFESNTSFTFDSAGYYEVSFSATSNIANLGNLRKETYQFTIIKPNEHKISYVYNKYANYYVEKVLKNGIDITETLINTLNVDTVTIKQQKTVSDNDGNKSTVVEYKKYMTQLPLSYLDEKTGEGEYVITVNTNNKMYNDFSQRFTYKITINSGTAPLRISLGEGKSTTGRILVEYNLQNTYLEMGESTMRVVRLLDNSALETVNSIQINSQSTGEGNISISTTGTYFIQIVSPSGNLMFTYKVVRNEPMNAAAIIAIVIGAVALVVVIFIIIKLRKRISVK